MNDLTVRSAPILELPDSLEVVLEGSVSPSAAPGLREQLEAALGRRSAFLSILMGSVNYVASAGLAYLMDLAGRMERRGGAVVLVNVQPDWGTDLSGIYWAIDQDGNDLADGAGEVVLYNSTVQYNGMDAGNVAAPK